LLAAALLAGAGVARGYLVGPPLGLDQLAAEADVIVKGTVVASAPAEDDWFKPCPGFAARETKFTVISVLKGEPGATLRFRHYDESPQPGGQGRMFQPQYYHFQMNRTYVVFAKKADDDGVCRQLWANHTGKEDQGVLMCPDDKPVSATTVKQALWDELARLLKCADAGDVTYAIRQLDQMSGGPDRFDSTPDFDRTEVLAAVHDLMTNPDPRIAQAAITVVGSHNPYLSDERTDYWLATVGSAEVPGIGKMDPKLRNIGGERYWKDLEAIASSPVPAETRATAIRALGLVREPVLRGAVGRWLADTEPAVRAAATVLLADDPGPVANQRLKVLAGDPVPTVRACVARAIGFPQQAELVDVLGKLLADPDREVRRVASVCLLSFSPKDEAVARWFRANLANKEFAPLFLNALAREKPEPYLDALARVVEEKTGPENWSGGEIPAFTAWKVLFRYLRTQPPATLGSGKLDRYLDALEKVGNYSSSEPRDLYAFYLAAGMPGRAARFREKANKAASYDLDYYFRQVDQNPANYNAVPPGGEGGKPAPSRKAPAPLFRDPVHDGAADATLVWNREEKCWWMLYTNRRADADDEKGVKWVHGTDIGMASTPDGGITWTYRGIARGLEFESAGTRNTFWAPEVVDSGGRYHAFISYVRGVPETWKGSRDIVHYTSANLVDWKFEAIVVPGSIDACVHRLPNGKWRMWFKNEQHKIQGTALDSDDLYTWRPTDSQMPEPDPGKGEGPEVFFWKGSFWMVKDLWRGLGVYRSPDLDQWQPTGVILDRPGRRPGDQHNGQHPGVLVQDADHAYLIYFVHQGTTEPGSRHTWLQIARLGFDGNTLTCDRDAEFDLDLKPPAPGFAPENVPEVGK